MAEQFYSDKKDMSEADRMRIGGELAKVQLDIEAKKEEKANVTRTYRVSIRQLEERSHSLSSQLDAGELDIKIAVEEVPDDSRMFMNILRADTKELIKSRPMNEVEKEQARKRKQATLAFDEGDGNGKPSRGARAPKAAAGAAPKKKNGKKS